MRPDVKTQCGKMNMTKEIDFTQHRALVVEDNDFVRFMVKKHLKDFGFAHVDEAPEGTAAVDLLKLQPDIVVCDINMSPMDGFEFLKHVRKSEQGGRRLPVIFLTGNADAESVQRAIGLDADGYMLKPVMPDALRKKIVMLMQKAGY